MKIFLPVFAALLLFTSCRKETDSCSLLRQGIINKNESAVRTAINQLIQSFPSQEYSTANFENLSNKISGCNVTILFKCFDCVQTLPSQSELRLMVDSTRGYQATIDISYTSDNTMKFHGMHD